MSLLVVIFDVGETGQTGNVMSPTCLIITTVPSPTLNLRISLFIHSAVPFNGKDSCDRHMHILFHLVNQFIYFLDHSSKKIQQLPELSCVIKKKKKVHCIDHTQNQWYQLTANQRPNPTD